MSRHLRTVIAHGQGAGALFGIVLITVCAVVPSFALHSADILIATPVLA